MKKYINLFLSMVFAAGFVTDESGGPTATLAPVDIQVTTSGVSRLSPVALTLTFGEDLSSWIQVFDNVIGSPSENTVSTTSAPEIDHGFFCVDAVTQ